MIEIVAQGQGAAIFPETMVRAQIDAGVLAEVLPLAQAQLQFEAAIRAGERDPVILELFRRAGGLRIE